MEPSLPDILRCLPPATLAVGLRDGAHVALWQESGGGRRHLLDRATDRALCGGAWDGIDAPLVATLREQMPPGTFRGWPGGWLHLSFDGAWRAAGDAAPPPSHAVDALRRLDLLLSEGVLVRLPAPESAHARLADGGRRAALAAKAAWSPGGIEDRVLGHVLGGAAVA